MGEYRVQRHNSVAAFSSQCGDWLQLNDIRNNEIISSIQLLESGRYKCNSEAYLATVLDDGRVCGCAVQALPDAFMVSDMPECMAKALLMDRLQQESPIDWLSASEVSAVRFGRIWEAELGKSWSIRFRWLTHAINEVKFPLNTAPGRLRRADESDHLLVTEWATRYSAESPAPVNVPEFLLRKLEEGNLFFWDSKGPKTVMSVSGQTANVIRISAVYTPEEYRGKGYAKAGVASLSALFLSQGLGSCILMTNEAKPDTAKLYSSIGFDVVDSRLSISLTD